MSTQTLDKPQISGTDNPELTHILSCCYEGEALCGEDLRGHQEKDTGVPCVVCEDLDNTGLTCCAIRATRAG